MITVKTITYDTKNGKRLKIKAHKTIQLNDIEFVKALGDYVEINTTDQVNM